MVGLKEAYDCLSRGGRAWHKGKQWEIILTENQCIEWKSGGLAARPPICPSFVFEDSFIIEEASNDEMPL